MCATSVQDAAAANNFHWDKRSWNVSADIVIARKTGKVSFDLSLAADGANFELVKKDGWKKDHCVICRWGAVRI